MTGRLLAKSAVLERLSVSRSTLHRLVAGGRFPAPTYVLGPRSPRWHEADVDVWMAKDDG